MRVHYDDRLEKVVTSVLGIVGSLAIIVNLALKGISLENILDAVKDMAGLIITVIVFMIASRFFSNRSIKGFHAKFESLLQEWADQNDCLIDPNLITVETDHTKKRVYRMVVDHVNLVDGNKATTVPVGPKKGDFLILPLATDWSDTNIIRFVLNKGTFKRRDEFLKNGEPDFPRIAEKLQSSIRAYASNRIEGIDVIAKKNEVAIEISKLEQTDDNARKLVELIDHVKLLYLAMS